jgi:trigger factor
VDHQTVLNIELEEEDLPPYLDRGYRRVVNRVSIPGFRKGKAPREIVERFLGRESLIQEAIDVMLPEVTERAISERDLETAGRPDVELVELDPVTVKATVALKPQVELGAYGEIRVAEEAVKVTDDEVQAKLQELLNGAASWEPVERPVRLGDMVTMDVSASIDGTDILNEKDAVYVADVESELPFPGFPQQLDGAEVGGAREFDLVIPADHANTEIAGKTASFSATVHEVKERSLPDLDDDFAKGVGEGFDDLGALRESVEQGLKAEAEESEKARYREASLNELVSLATVELPPLLVEHEVEHSTEHRDRLIERLQMRMDDYLRYTGKTEDEMREEMREDAVEKLNRSYLLSALAEQEGEASG